MIIIKKWNSDINFDKKVFHLIKKTFNLENNDFLIPGKSITISLFDKNNLVGIINLLPNSNLFSYLNKKISEEELSENYCIRAKKGIYIYNLTVNKEYQGKGYGNKLLKIAVIVSKLLKYEYCHAHCVNKKSESIFYKNRFIKEKYFSNNDSSLVSLWL